VVEAGLHDHSTIAVEVRGDGPTVLLAVNPTPVEGPQAEELRRWGVDPALGRTLVNAEVDWSQVEVTLSEGQTRQFVTLYQALQDFDDRAAQARLRCPRLCFVGSADQITYDERWGGVRVDMADPLISRRAELEALGWRVQVLEGLDHLQAMQAAHVLPILRPWLLDVLGTGG
jgi:glutaredoxin-related protein